MTESDTDEERYRKEWTQYINNLERIGERLGYRETQILENNINSLHHLVSIAALPEQKKKESIEFSDWALNEIRENGPLVLEEVKQATDFNFIDVEEELNRISYLTEDDTGRWHLTKNPPEEL